MKRLVLSIPLALACTALGAPGAAARDSVHVHIEHLDGTGTRTIVEVQPSIPGVGPFIRSSPAPIPEPGQVMLPPSATPTWSPVPSPTPRRY